MGSPRSQQGQQPQDFFEPHHRFLHQPQEKGLMRSVLLPSKAPAKAISWSHCLERIFFFFFFFCFLGCLFLFLLLFFCKQSCRNSPPFIPVTVQSCCCGINNKSLPALTNGCANPELPLAGLCPPAAERSSQAWGSGATRQHPPVGSHGQCPMLHVGELRNPEQEEETFHCLCSLQNFTVAKCSHPLTHILNKHRSLRVHSP